jgi:TfoX/Sxy family transcriptional regulator of competence genes
MPFHEQLAKSIEKDFLKRPGVQCITYSGGIGYAVGDDMFAFLSDDGVVLKLEETERQALLHAPNARHYQPKKPGARDELVELVLNTFMDVMTAMEWVRRAYSEAANRAGKSKGHHRRGLFSR